MTWLDDLDRFAAIYGDTETPDAPLYGDVDEFNTLAPVGARYQGRTLDAGTDGEIRAVYHYGRR